MPTFTRHFPKALLILAMAFSMSVAPIVLPAMATEVRYVVNDQPITNYDINRRVALLRLMRRGGDLNQAAVDEMINQTLRRQELQRSGVAVTQAMIDDAYANFAASNDLTVAQLDRILSEAGVTKEHFQGFMSVQIGWGRFLQSRSGSGGELSEAEVVERIMQQGGQKPSTTEYRLQQVIFVVPSAQRSQLLSQRQGEARAMRGRFNGCDTTVEAAKGIIDVTVRDQGRVLEPELPADWKDDIVGLGPGQATPVRTTDRGVEFIGVCSTRQVSDDHVAKLMFQNEDTEDTSVEQLSEELTSELRENARIIQR
ncbi:peptidylprolyl isomerase [Chelativorans sp. YIM 93263]|uniref:peptidylprolyl isomerase n=1 Tax=Chelativorans sp. YIM 93263 TaxID=2906648 RepID=UPI002377DC3E|nr:peptidylprolyl isomerase [Chelativorans sp. YIM 93263]